MNVLEEKIMTKKRFSAGVEELVSKNNMTYIDAMNYIIEKRGMDYSNIKKLLSDSLKEKVTAEAQGLNLIKEKKGNTLPVCPGTIQKGGKIAQMAGLKQCTNQEKEKKD